MLDWWLPPNVSAPGAYTDIDWLFHLIYWVTGATFVIVQTLLIVFAIRYRYNPARRATYTHGNTSLEIAWTVAPALLLALLAFYSRKGWADIKEHVPPTDVIVRVTAKQFNWEVTYPGPDGKLDTEDDVTQDNDLHVPVMKTVRVLLKSRDVIHSFFVPQLRLKQDAVPGHEIPAWFRAAATGDYEIPCAELCGFGHSGMLGHLHVHDAEGYAAWAKESGAVPVPGA